MRWHGIDATWPLARLAIDERGITARLRAPVLSRLALSWAWNDIDRVEPVRDAIRKRNVGVAFYGRARFVFWCWPTAFARVIEDVRRYAPDKLVPRGRTLVVAGVVLTRGTDGRSG
jgi:hypothetical protein